MTVSMAGALVPTDARLVDEGLLAIVWSDGRTLHYPLDHLRARCPCAHCAKTLSDEPPLTPEAFRGIRLRGLDEVGSYAFQISFSDGHGLGIYTFDYLRSIGFPEGEAPVTRPPAVFDV